MADVREEEEEEELHSSDAVETSTSHEEQSETEPEDGEEEDDVDRAIVELAEGDSASDGQEDGEDEEEDASRRGDWLHPHQVDDSDSSEDERPSRNTVGNVPLEWYKDEEHIGYDKEGNKIIKSKKKDELAKLLDKVDDKNAWRTIYDEYNDEQIVLTKEEIKMIQRIRTGRYPHAEINPFDEPFEFEYKEGIHPLSNAPEPKRRFMPSKWEAKKVVKLVRALRRGWLKLDKEEEKPKVYLMWDDDLHTTDKTQNGLAYIPAPKPRLPGHEESYHPPQEYLPSEEELKAYELMDEEERPNFIPKSYDCLRRVPAYADFVRERFERCLDLYLCPRVRKNRLNIDPETLKPKLPSPKDLKPFPSVLSMKYRGHTGKVWSIAVDPQGRYLASGGEDGTLRLWEVYSGRLVEMWRLGGPVHSVAWCPDSSKKLLSCSVGKSAMLIWSKLGGELTKAAVEEHLKIEEQQGEGQQYKWQPLVGVEVGLEILHRSEVSFITWHHRGDYFATVSPGTGGAAVLIHQLSKKTTQSPFKKNKGQVVRVLFHPGRPIFFVATQNHIRVYNLVKQQLIKKLLGGSGALTSMAVHPGGDNLITGSGDRRVSWYDMDLSTKPYKAVRYHDHAVQAVAFHRSYPLFASASDDGSCHVYHGMVYSDLMQNPLIVPVKILRGHQRTEALGVLDCAFHPKQPWVFTAGADADIHLYTNN